MEPERVGGMTQGAGEQIDEFEAESPRGLGRLDGMEVADRPETRAAQLGA